jgi:hypothetical protein
MNTPERFAELVQAFFCDYLIKQRDLSPRTVSTYRDTFRLLLNFLQRACGKQLDQLMLSNLTATQLIAFLQYLEEERGNCVRTRNLRLAALRSFFRYVGACEGPEMIAQIQRIMAIPLKRFARPLLGFLSQSEMQLSCKRWTTPGAAGVIICSFFFSTIPEPGYPRLSPSGCKTCSETITALCSCWAKAECNERCPCGKKPLDTSVPG